MRLTCVRKDMQIKHKERRQTIDISEYIPTGCAIGKKQVLLIKHSLTGSFSCCSIFGTNMFLHVMHWCFFTRALTRWLAATYLPVMWCYAYKNIDTADTWGRYVRMCLLLKGVQMYSVVSGEKN